MDSATAYARADGRLGTRAWCPCNIPWPALAPEALRQRADAVVKRIIIQLVTAH
jgi:hypothetical protein